MGCCGTRRKLADVGVEQKWEYINFDDFHSTSCWTPLSYGVLYISLLISIAVYVVDTFTAINLLAFDRWSGQIKPVIPLTYSRWIFGGCIILSFVFLFFRWLRAVRVMRNGGVAESYLDPLAVRVQSVRMGKAGRGWKRFLVFAELTKGRKGASYVALFTYFSFEAWLRILFAEGPRQIINALTLYSVMQLNLLPTGENEAKDGRAPIAQFFENVRVLADKQGREQAAILFAMLFTVIIWLVTFINLMVAVVLYLVFLFHHIPSSDRGLSGYCRRKMNKSMEDIVNAKVEKALRKESALQARQEAKEGADAANRQPTLPSLDPESDEKPPLLSRQATGTTLPEYSSRPGTSAGSNLPNLDSPGFRPRPLNRVDTNASSASWVSYGSNAPLIGGAGGMGHGPPGSLHSPGPISPTGSPYARPTPNRSYSGYSHSSQRSYTPAVGPHQSIRQNGRSFAGSYHVEPASRPSTAMSGRHTPGAAPSPIDSYGRAPPGEQNNPYFPAIADTSGRSTQATVPRSNTPGSTSMRSYPPGDYSSMRSITPAVPSYGRSYTPGQPLARLQTNTSLGSDDYRSNITNPYTST